LSDYLINIEEEIMTHQPMEIVMCLNDEYHEFPKLESYKLYDYSIDYRTNPELIKIVKDKIDKGESKNLRIYPIDPRFANHLDLIEIEYGYYNELI